jgi:hypothetical protein
MHALCCTCSRPRLGAANTAGWRRGCLLDVWCAGCRRRPRALWRSRGGDRPPCAPPRRPPSRGLLRGRMSHGASGMMQTRMGNIPKHSGNFRRTLPWKPATGQCPAKRSVLSTLWADQLQAGSLSRNKGHRRKAIAMAVRHSPMLTSSTVSRPKVPEFPWNFYPGQSRVIVVSRRAATQRVRANRPHRSGSSPRSRTSNRQSPGLSRPDGRSASPSTACSPVRSACRPATALRCAGLRNAGRHRRTTRLVASVRRTRSSPGRPPHRHAGAAKLGEPARGRAQGSTTPTTRRRAPA